MVGMNHDGDQLCYLYMLWCLPRKGNLEHVPVNPEVSGLNVSGKEGKRGIHGSGSDRIPELFLIPPAAARSPFLTMRRD